MKTGLIAGNGNLPFVMADQIHANGDQVYVCAIKGEVDLNLSERVDAIEWVKLGQLKKLIQFFQKNDVKQVVMGGKITKTNLFKGEIQPDLEMVKVVAKLPNWKDDTLLGAIADYLDSKGVKLLSSVALLAKSLPKAGVLTKKKPDARDLEELDFAWKIAKEIAGLDIGQTIVVKDKAVLAVEAIEGTDEAILRGAKLGNGGVTVIKVAKPKQDMRFDVPTIGLTTLAALIQAKARMLVFEAGKTIFLDQEKFVNEANQNKLIVMAK